MSLRPTALEAPQDSARTPAPRGHVVLCCLSCGVTHPAFAHSTPLPGTLSLCHQPGVFQGRAGRALCPAFVSVHTGCGLDLTLCLVWRGAFSRVRWGVERTRVQTDEHSTGAAWPSLPWPVTPMPSARRSAPVDKDVDPERLFLMTSKMAEGKLPADFRVAGDVKP